MEYTAFLVGVMHYVQELRWGDEVGGVQPLKSGSGYLSAAAFPAPLPTGDPIMGRVSGSLAFSMGGEGQVCARDVFSYSGIYTGAGSRGIDTISGKAHDLCLSASRRGCPIPVH